MTAAAGGWTEITSRGAVYRCLELPGRSYPLRLLEPARSGPAAGAAVFVHGMEEPWDVWEGLLPRLNRRFRVFLLDLPWSGRHGYDWTLDRATAAEWLKRGLDAVPPGPAVLVAHSFGSMAALEHLDTCGAGDLRGLAVLSPFYLPRGKALSWPLIDHYTSKFVPFLEAALRVRDGMRHLDPDIVATAASIVREKIGPVGCLEFLYLFAKSTRWRLDALRLPSLVLGGGEDFFSTPEVCSDLAAAMPGAELKLLPSCGHFCMLEQAEQSSALLDDFLTRCFARATDPGRR
jgi:pimeloyl-ACP methyl ester carboxylesterase